MSNKDIMDNNATLKLGMMAMEPDLAQDVRIELEEEDAKHPPELGKSCSPRNFIVELSEKKASMLQAGARSHCHLHALATS